MAYQVNPEAGGGVDEERLPVQVPKGDGRLVGKRMALLERDIELLMHEERRLAVGFFNGRERDGKVDGVLEEPGLDLARVVGVGILGMVETDYDGSYGHMISDKSVRNGNNLMLGFGSATTDQYTDQSATATLALRQACKNILYTIVNSGYYTGVDSDPSLAPDKMTTTFNTINMGCGAALVVIEALAIWLLMKGRKAAAAA